MASTQLTPEQDAALEQIANLVVDQVKLFEKIAEKFQVAEIPMPSFPLISAELAKKILAREDCPDQLKMPLPLLEQYLHQTLHLRMDVDDEIEKLK